MNIDYKKILRVALPLLVALISMFGVSKIATSTEFHADTLEALDEKRETVMELTAASTATSAAITLIPGDTATPIAEKLADYSSYFLIVLCAIYLEKYLVTITGYAAFVVLIPIGCVLYAASVFIRDHERTCKQLANKLLLFGLAIVLVIPASVKVSNLIEDTYQASIENTIETAKQTAGEVEKEAEEEDSSWLDSVTNKVTEVGEKVETSINNFIEALAVLLVTSCVIPIAVMMFFVWLIKSMLAIDIELPKKKPLDMLRMK